MIDWPEIGRFVVGYALHGLKLLRIEGVLSDIDDMTVTLDPGDGCVKVRVYKQMLVSLS